MATQPMRANAGAGLSLLDSVLLSRAAETGVVDRTRTRLLMVARLAAGADTHAVCDYIARFLEARDPEMRGLLIIQARSLLQVVEAAPEVVVALLRHLQVSTTASEPVIEAVRIIAHTEDVPERVFGPWTYVTLSLPSEGGGGGSSSGGSGSAGAGAGASAVAADIDAAPALTTASRLYRNVIEVGAALAAGGEVTVSSLQERFASVLPSDERVVALASSDKFTSVDEYLELFDAPMSASFSVEATLPLPPRTAYRTG